MTTGLGTQLRHLIDLLDGAVGAAYAEAGLDYRPRFTPVMKALAAEAPCTVGRMAQIAGITQPAATQTLALMQGLDLIEPVAGPGAVDARQKFYQLSAQGCNLLPQLEQCWGATTAAAKRLDSELAYPLSTLLAQAIEALEAKPYLQRIRAARVAQDKVLAKRKLSNKKS